MVPSVAGRTDAHCRVPLPSPRSLSLALVLLTPGCESTGSDHVLAVEATGVARGLVYFDADGDREPAAPDTGLAGVAVELFPAGGRAPVARVVSDSSGRFRMAGLPVGSFVTRIDSATVPDSMAVVRIADSSVLIPPADSVVILVAVGFPRVSIAEARLLPVGAKVFVDGIALNAFATFGDSTLHVADTGTAIRALRVRPVAVFAGDSVRLVGTVGASGGQPVLTGATVFLLAIRAAPPPMAVTTALARSADGGRLDASLVEITGATITDTATLANDDVALTVNDGSGALEVVLDDDVVFTLALYTPGEAIDALGVLVPVGGGVWRLKPRFEGDLVVN